MLCSSSSYLFLLLKSYTLQNHFYYSLLPVSYTHLENSDGGESINYTFNELYEKSLKTVVGKKIGKEASKVTEYEVIDYIQSLNNNQVEGAQDVYKRQGCH